MSYQSKRYEVYMATEDDLEGIKKVFYSGSFDGAIGVQYLRDPDPIQSFLKEGDACYFVVLKEKETNLIIGIGACIQKNVFIQGEIKRLGYLAALKILPEYQKKIYFIPQIYEYLHEQTKENIDLYFTTILSENIAVQKMLEKQRKSMPLYLFTGDYRVYFCKSGIKKKKISKDIRRCEPEELDLLYKEAAKTMNGSLSELKAYDLKNAVFYGYFINGQAVTGGYVLNQQTYKQYVVKKYGFPMNILSKAPTRILGYPSFPKCNETANCACAAIWDIEGDTIRRKELWKYMRMDVTEYDFLMLGLHESDAFRLYMEKEKHIPYDSRCYIVDWEHNPEKYESIRKQGWMMDVAFL